MTVLKGQYVGCEIAEDGSSVKVRLAGGSSVRLSIADLAAFAGDLVNALSAARMSQAVRPEKLPTRYEAPPVVVKAADFNVTHSPESGAFSLEGSDDRGRRAILTLEAAHVRFLLAIYETTSRASGHELH